MRSSIIIVSNSLCEKSTAIGLKNISIYVHTTRSHLKCNFSRTKERREGACNRVQDNMYLTWCFTICTLHINASHSFGLHAISSGLYIISLLLLSKDHTHFVSCGYYRSCHITQGPLLYLIVRVK